jgi:hypothetical protein
MKDIGTKVICPNESCEFNKDEKCTKKMIHLSDYGQPCLSYKQNPNFGIFSKKPVKATS